MARLRNRGSKAGHRTVKLTGADTTALVLLAQKPSSSTRSQLESSLEGVALRVAKMFASKPVKGVSKNERHLAKLFRNRVASLK